MAVVSAESNSRFTSTMGRRSKRPVPVNPGLDPNLNPYGEFQGTPRLVINVGRRAAAGAEVSVPPKAPALQLERANPSGDARIDANLALLITRAAARNGWVGTTWMKNGEPRRVVGTEAVVPAVGTDKTPRLRVLVERGSDSGTVVDRVPMDRFPTQLGSQITEGLISDVVVPDNQDEIAAGTIAPFTEVEFSKFQPAP